MAPTTAGTTCAGIDLDPISISLSIFRDEAPPLVEKYAGKLGLAPQTALDLHRQGRVFAVKIGDAAAIGQAKILKQGIHSRQAYLLKVRGIRDKDCVASLALIAIMTSDLMSRGDIFVAGPVASKLGGIEDDGLRALGHVVQSAHEIADETLRDALLTHGASGMLFRIPHASHALAS